MSRPRYDWWGYVRRMLRRYPDKSTKSEKNAIEAAIAITEQMVNGQARLKVVDLALIKGTHTLAGAALAIPCSYETAKRYQQSFIMAVADNFECKGLVEW